MAFPFHVTIPAGTPEENPIRETLIVEPGIIYKIHIISSWGTNGEVFCKLEDIYGRQILPVKEGSYFRLWGQVIEAKYPAIQFEAKGDKTRIVFVGWSPGTQYDHVVDVTFWIASDVDVVKRMFGIEKI